ncbi:hypothetical protein MNBD_DELTA02-744 [hydrothermal vent metagenome]|uniref:Uncharacterized protein n=1 Tax=hydrothermal vent metagenome TaxID=652676 RepID=A0A3B0VAU4_9ZZZZ
MKKLLTISLLLMLALWSCTGEPDKPPEPEKETGAREDKPVASGEIIDRYVKTLTTARGKARAAGEATEDRTRRMQEAIGD